MPNIARIPEHAKRGLAKLIVLDDQIVDELVKYLSSVPRIFENAGTATALASKFGGGDREDITSILTTLISLASIGPYFESDLNQISKDVVQAMEGSGDPTLRLDNKRDAFERKLQKLLSVDTLSLAAKAFGVMNHNLNVFCSARIVTEMRPVFLSDLTTAPGGTAIVHNLKISYHRGKNLEDFFVALDIEDIRKLKATLERADLKAATLKKHLLESHERTTL